MPAASAKLIKGAMPRLPALENEERGEDDEGEAHKVVPAQRFAKVAGGKHGKDGC